MANENDVSFFKKVLDILEDHPFLAYSIAGIFALLISFTADSSKTEPYILLFYFLIGAPIIMQFYVEILKAKYQGKQPSSQESASRLKDCVPSFTVSLMEFLVGILLLVVFVALINHFIR